VQNVKKLADKMFTNYNLSLLRQHTVNQSFSVLSSPVCLVIQPYL